MTHLARMLLLLLVLAVPASTAHAAFPGANGRIAFWGLGFGLGTQSNLFSIEPDGTDLIPLAKRSYDPSFSPSGTQIAFSSPRFEDSEIRVMSADGSSGARLTHNRVSDTGPSYSNTGELIVWAHDRTGIWRMGGDGSGKKKILGCAQVKACVALYDPVWSPLGERIAFTMLQRLRDADRYTVWTMRPNGSGLNRLTDGPSDHSPNWAPDGEKIAFDSYRGGQRNVFVMDADGHTEHRLTPNGGAYPAFSPDGGLLAFSRQLATDHDALMVLDMATDDIERITGKTDYAYDPDWQPLPALGQRNWAPSQPAFP